VNCILGAPSEIVWPNQGGGVSSLQIGIYALLAQKYLTPLKPEDRFKAVFPTYCPSMRDMTARP
jgi:hypothetical protein